MNCHGCFDKAARSDLLKCNSCAAYYCRPCLGVSAEEASKLTTMELASLGCPSCMNVTRRRVRDDTPVRAGSSFVQDLDMSYDTIIASGPKAEHSQTLGVGETLSLDMIGRLLDQKLAPASPFMCNLRVFLREDIKKMIEVEVGSSMQKLKADFTDTTDFLAAEQNDLKNEIKAKDKQIMTLQNEHSRLQKELNDVRGLVGSIDKVSRSRNLEIHVVPESRNENVLQLFKTLCDIVNCPLNESEVHACRRVAKFDKASNRPRTILVTLSSPRLRDNLMSAFFRFNKANPKDLLHSGHLGLAGERRRIFISEHLSPELKQLHAATRQTARERGYERVSVRYGRIYVRKDLKDESSNYIHIKSMECLNKLV